MANTSIYNAFERMWQHVVVALGDKVSKVEGKGLSTNDFTNEYKGKVDSALQSFTETDPTVPAWAKAANKPTYTAAEVGLGNVNNTADAEKDVKYAASAGIATKATQDADGNVISETYMKKGESSSNGDTYTATISTNWQGTSAPYTQEIVVGGILPGDNPVADLIPSGIYETAQLEEEELAKIYSIKTEKDKIIVYANEPTTRALTIQFLVVREKAIKVGTQYYSLSLSPSAWTGSTAPYIQSVQLADITEQDRPKVYFEAPDSFNDLATQQDAFAALYDVETANGVVIFRAQALPEVSFNVTLEVNYI
jgi:hypothetical protein